MDANDQHSPLFPPVHFLDVTEKEKISRLLFHVHSADYFAYLSTVLGFVEEALLERTVAPEPELRLIRQMRSELAYLNDTFLLQEKPPQN